VVDRRSSYHLQVFEAWQQDPCSSLLACSSHSATDTSLDLNELLLIVMHIDLVCASGRAGSSGYIVDKDFCSLSWKAACPEPAVSVLPH